MAYQFKIGPSKQMTDVFLAPGKKIIQAQDIVPICDQAITEMGTQESCPSCHQDTPLSTDHLLQASSLVLLHLYTP
jgi:hypothetical protein